MSGVAYDKDIYDTGDNDNYATTIEDTPGPGGRAQTRTGNLLSSSSGYERCLSCVCF
jgi:hypothetical protein